ncbi:glycosyltransferase [Spirosoma soli]|uniref:Glycosyltransferase n=1 Tax=Spirosoma soli TaxID=1770529 RepID=A0ABW5M2D6_9BACT
MKRNTRKRYLGTVIDPSIGIITLNSHINLNDFSKELYPYIDRKIYVICGLWWSIESIKEIIQMIYIIAKNKILYPKINVSILCNTQKELKILKFLKINAIYCNHNCFIDENIFDINNNKKKYKAVYNAVLSRFKRHILCSKIEGLTLITYKYDNTKYKKYLEENLHSAVWQNYKENGAIVFLTSDESASVYNQSYVGLALSKVEGAMYSSTEYLLCGIPVVSTKSKGGRDIFYNIYNSIICKANSTDVSMAVDILSKRNVNPYKIRKDTLELMLAHRQRFVEHINLIIKKNNLGYDIRDTWNNWYINKLRHELYVEDLKDLLFKKAVEVNQF